jgi:hypothetical protein
MTANTKEYGSSQPISSEMRKRAILPHRTDAKIKHATAPTTVPFRPAAAGHNKTAE